MKKNVCGVGKKVLASALSAAMVVAFAPAVGAAVGSDDAVAYAEDGQTVENAIAKVGDLAFTSLKEAFASEAFQTEQTASLLGNAEEDVTIEEAGTYLELDCSNFNFKGSVVLSADDSSMAVCNGTANFNKKSSFAQCC